MKKFNVNMIFGKKQIILACLVMALGIAVYMNWSIVESGEDYSVSNLLENTAADGEVDNTEKKYGDSQYVDSTNIVSVEDIDPAGTEVYFTEAKLNRQKTRDEAVETLQVMMQNTQVDAQTKSELAMQATQIAKSIEAEGRVENLIKAKGFTECMVYLDEEQANIVVQTDGLLDNEAAQIKDIILKETSVPVENISIVEVN